MHIDQHGHPIHTRALQVRLAIDDGDTLRARGYLLDLRKRGFVPVGSALQGSGIIHHMEIELSVDRRTGEILSIAAPQPTVAFEANEASAGESCRDPSVRLANLIGCRVEDALASSLRETFGGPLGCSHLLALAQFALASVATHRDTRREVDGAWTVQRDLVIDGNEVDEQAMSMALQLSELVALAPQTPTLPAETLLEHVEVRAEVMLGGWPAEIQGIKAAQRRRSAASFAVLTWEEPATFNTLLGLNLGRGGSAEINRRLASEPVARDAFLMLGPALIQCRASFPDRWLAQVLSAPRHPGLIAQADSCYMWRRGGGLETVRTLLTQADREDG